MLTRPTVVGSPLPVRNPIVEPLFAAPCKNPAAKLITPAAVLRAVQTRGRFTITAPGLYCLVGDIEVAATGVNPIIQLQTSNISLNLGGYSIINTIGPGTQTAGQGGNLAAAIGYDWFTSGNVNNLSVYNGTIRNFSYGMLLNGGNGRMSNLTNVHIHDINMSNMNTGIHTSSAGDVRITHTTMTDVVAGISLYHVTTGTIQDALIHITLPKTAPFASYGINTNQTAGITIQDNQIYGNNTMSGTGLYGLSVAMGTDYTIQNNVIRGITNAIMIDLSQRVDVLENHLGGFAPPLGVSGTGIQVSDTTNIRIDNNILEQFPLGLSFIRQSTGQYDQNKTCGVNTPLYIAPGINTTQLIAGPSNQWNPLGC